jgi:hypothetical protein
MSSAPTTSPTNVFDWHARLIERAAVMFGHSILHTDPAKIDWRPDMDGQAKCRTIRAQIAECTQVNRAMAKLLRGEDPGKPDFEEGADFATPEEGVNELKSSANELAESIRGLDDEALTRPYKTGLGTLTGAQVIELALANMNYHMGQVNYIQMMYGDTEFRIPQEFFS